MKTTYQGTVVESSLPLDSIIFQREEKPEKPTDPETDKETSKTKTVKQASARKR